MQLDIGNEPPIVYIARYAFSHLLYSLYMRWQRFNVFLIRELRTSKEIHKCSYNHILSLRFQKPEYIIFQMLIIDKTSFVAFACLDNYRPDIIDSILYKVRHHQFFYKCFFCLSFDDNKQSFHHGLPPIMFFSHSSPTE